MFSNLKLVLVQLGEERCRSDVSKTSYRVQRMCAHEVSKQILPMILSKRKPLLFSM